MENSRSISSIKTAEPFVSLFPIDQATLTGVIDDMTANGYDWTQPIILWRGVVIDGHTRLEAARSLKLDRVPVAEKLFADEDEAVRYAIHLQKDRRNLTNADILRFVMELDKRKSAGRPSAEKLASVDANYSGKSAAETAAAIGVSTTMVERARRIADGIDESLKKAVLSGEKSINQATNEIRSSKTESTRLTVAPNLPLATYEGNPAASPARPVPGASPASSMDADVSGSAESSLPQILARVRRLIGEEYRNCREWERAEFKQFLREMSETLAG